MDIPEDVLLYWFSLISPVVKTTEFPANSYTTKTTYTTFFP